MNHIAGRSFASFLGQISPGHVNEFSGQQAHLLGHGEAQVVGVKQPQQEAAQSHVVPGNAFCGQGVG